MIASWCRVLKEPAVNAAARSSLCAASPNPTEFVWRLAPNDSDMNETTRPESMPPERKAPNGTSLSSRSWTA